MSIEQLVPSKEVCEQLKQAGFPQETCFYWVCDVTHGDSMLKLEKSSSMFMESLAAPTAQELFSVLGECDIIKSKDGYAVYTNDSDGQQSTAKGEHLAETLARLFLYLKSNNLL